MSLGGYPGAISLDTPRLHRDRASRIPLNPPYRSDVGALGLHVADLLRDNRLHRGQVWSGHRKALPGSLWREFDTITNADGQREDGLCCPAEEVTERSGGERIRSREPANLAALPFRTG